MITPFEIVFLAICVHLCQLLVAAFALASLFINEQYYLYTIVLTNEDLLSTLDRPKH